MSKKPALASTRATSKNKPPDFDVFLSYSSKDKKRVRSLVSSLREQGITVWFDEDQVNPGDNIPIKIDNGLATSRWLVIALSHSSVKSSWCRAEFAPFLQKEIERSQARVVPVLLEEIEDDDIPPLLYAKHRIHLNRPDGLQQLVRRVRRPLSLTAYCERIRNTSLVSLRLFNDDYHVHPSDLLYVVLREVSFRVGAPVRAVVGNERPITLGDFVNELRKTGSHSGRNNVLVILGEAGVGKSTTCKLLCRILVDKKSPSAHIPLYIPLGNYKPGERFEDFIDSLIEGGSFDELIKAAREANLRLAIFLDGLNEQTTETLSPIIAWARHLTRSQNVTIVMTSRPLISATQIWQENEAKFFELQRWTKEQLRQFLRENGWGSLSEIPAQASDSLRLPLLASLLVRRVDHDFSLLSLRTVADVFGYLLEQFFKSASERDKGQHLPQKHLRPRRVYKAYLSELAYQMTCERTVQTEGRMLERILSHSDRAQFKSLLTSLLNSGLLHSFGTVTLEPNATLSDLRPLKITFLHQAFQEYLTSQHFMTKSPPALPADVSNDTFWREVPIYIMQSLGASVTRQRSFVLSFLNRDAPDYLTAARLAREISDPGVRKLVKERVISQLIVNIGTPKLYKNAIEAFLALEPDSHVELRECLRDVRLIQTVFTEFESHLVGRPASLADETAWRPLGRSVYLLGELGDLWLGGYLNRNLHKILSPHLLYHAGEALLSLARIPLLPPHQRSVIMDAASELSKHPRGDAVTAGYAFAVANACGMKTKRRGKLAAELVDFLYDQAVNDRPYFRDEFGRRAHGVEAFAEVAERDAGVEVLTRLFQTEDTVEYNWQHKIGYPEVQSSILKAALRLCNIYGSSDVRWQSFLEDVFTSRRVADNEWACRHLERLLLRYVDEPLKLRWLKGWKESKALGGKSIRSVLANVILQCD